MQPSAELPIPGLVAYEQFRQRMREHFAAVRSLFVERFREFLLDPPPPESAFLHCDNRYEGVEVLAHLVDWRTFPLLDVPSDAGPDSGLVGGRTGDVKRGTAPE